MVARATSTGTSGTVSHSGELMFWFVRAGQVAFDLGDVGLTRLGEGDSISLVPGHPYSLELWSADAEVLEVTLPGSRTATG